MTSFTSPNILFLFTDQLRADCIAALGNSKIKTPNIDRLVREGTTFSSCYTPSPVCAPARQSLCSGLPPHITGRVDNVDAFNDSPSFMQGLVDTGYQTHGIGKMHFSKRLGDWGFTSRNISEEMTTKDSRDDYRNYLDENGYGHVIDAHGLRSELYYLPQPSQLPASLHHSHWVADGSIEFLKQRNPSKPFLLWSSFIKPHPPFESPNPWGRLYRMHEMDEPVLPEGSDEHSTFWSKVQNRYKYQDEGNYNRHLSRTIRAAYYAAISFIDYNIGRILEALGSDIDNTLIILSSDHGEMLGDFGCYGKRSMLNPSVRVPMIARLPGTFPEDFRCNTPTTLLDIYPTFLTLAGDAPNRPNPEGISLTEAMEPAHHDRIVFSQFSQNQLGLYMAANRDWKYIYSAADDKEWLFDLKNDPTETRNKLCDQECASQLELLKDACIQRFRRDGILEPIDGDDWKRYPAAVPPILNSDEGLLFQDPEELEKQIEALGHYARSTDFTKDNQYNLLERLCDVSRPTPETSENLINDQGR